MAGAADGHAGPSCNPTPSKRDPAPGTPVGRSGLGSVSVSHRDLCCVRALPRRTRKVTPWALSQRPTRPASASGNEGRLTYSLATTTLPPCAFPAHREAVPPPDPWRPRPCRGKLRSPEATPTPRGLSTGGRSLQETLTAPGQTPLPARPHRVPPVSAAGCTGRGGSRAPTIPQGRARHVHEDFAAG